MDKIEIIMKTARMLAEENRGEWSGDVHEFATASAYITPDERLWLTSGDVKNFHKELKDVKTGHNELRKSIKSIQEKSNSGEEDK